MAGWMKAKAMRSLPLSHKQAEMLRVQMPQEL